MNPRLRSILEFVGLIAALAVTPAMSQAQVASTQQVTRPTIVLAFDKTPDSVLTVGSNSTFVLKYSASGAHNCNLETHDHANNVVTSGIAPSEPFVVTVKPEHPWYPPSAKYPTTFKVTCYDVRGAVIATSPTLVVKRS